MIALIQRVDEARVEVGASSGDRFRPVSPGRRCAPGDGMRQTQRRSSGAAIACSSRRRGTHEPLGFVDTPAAACWCPSSRFAADTLGHASASRIAAAPAEANAGSTAWSSLMRAPRGRVETAASGAHMKVHLRQRRPVTFRLRGELKDPPAPGKFAGRAPGLCCGMRG